jgi:hypothetical protein
MKPLVLWLLQSATWTVTPAAPTVGDTVVIERTLTEGVAGARAQVDAIQGGPSIEALRAPDVSYQDGQVRVRHTVAVFGRAVEQDMPSIDLIFPDGSIQTIPGGSVAFAVRSVLPASDTLPEPRWSQPPIQRRLTAVTYPVLFTLLAVSFSVGWGMVRRRSRPVPSWAGSVARGAEPPLTRWISCGEPRAVAAWMGERVRRRLAALVPEAGIALDVEECMNVIRKERPDWPHRELADLLRTLERACFAPAVPSDVLAVADDVDELLGRLEAPQTTETS